MKAITERRSKAALSALLVLLIASAGVPVGAAGGNEPPAAVSSADGLAAALTSTDSPEGASPGTQTAASVPTGLYRGKVTERRSGKPVEGAVLVFMSEETGESFEAVTDKTGAYETRLPAGEYLVDIKVGKKVYRSAGTFREEATGKRWVMDFTIGSKLTERDLKIETTPKDIRVVATAPRPPLEPSRKMLEFWIFLGGLIAVGALAD